MIGCVPFLTMQSGDHGVGPREAPAALHAAIMAHYFDGAYYPKGGARSIPRAYIRALSRHGGEIRVRAPVSKILIEGTGRRRRAVGVELADGTSVSADYVVSNADPGITFGELVGRRQLSRRLRRRLSRTEYSPSALSLFCATDLDLESMGFDSGNYWYSRTARVEDVYDLAKRDDLLDSGELPGIFLTITTLKDRSKRNDGLHTIECFALASYDLFKKWKDSPYGERPQEYEMLKERLTEMIVRRMDDVVPGLSKHIIFSELGTPLTKAHYIHATRGSLYGTAKRWNQIGPWAYPVQTEIQGLFMCGASTQAHGVAGVTETGITAAKKIAKCRARDFLNEQDQHLTILPCDAARAEFRTATRL